MNLYGYVYAEDLLGANEECPTNDDVVENVTGDLLGTIKTDFSIDESLRQSLEVIKCEFNSDFIDNDDGVSGKFTVAIKTNRELSEQEIEQLEDYFVAISEDYYWQGFFDGFELYE